MNEHKAVLSPAALRMRRSRERRREGLRCLRIEVRNSEIDALVNRGLLKPEARNNRSALVKAIYEFFEQQLEPVS